MPDESEQSQGHAQEQPPKQEQLPKGLGWLLKPTGAGEIGVYISGVEGATEFTPGMRQTLEELMQRLQREMQDLAARPAKECPKLEVCGENKVSCPVVNFCGTYRLQCPKLEICGSH